VTSCFTGVCVCVCACFTTCGSTGQPLQPCASISGGGDSSFWRHAHTHAHTDTHTRSADDRFTRTVNALLAGRLASQPLSGFSATTTTAGCCQSCTVLHQSLVSTCRLHLSTLIIMYLMIFNTVLNAFIVDLRILNFRDFFAHK